MRSTSSFGRRRTYRCLWFDGLRPDLSISDEEELLSKNRGNRCSLPRLTSSGTTVQLTGYNSAPAEDTPSLRSGKYGIVRATRGRLGSGQCHQCFRQKCYAMIFISCDVIIIPYATWTDRFPFCGGSAQSVGKTKGYARSHGLYRPFRRPRYILAATVRRIRNDGDAAYWNIALRYIFVVH